MPMQMQDLRDLYIHKLQDLYDAERQITQAIPQMLDKVQDQQLKQGMQQHLEVTQKQIQRLEQIFQKMGEKPGQVKCEGMQGLVQEGQKLLKGNGNPEAIEAGLIAAQQAIEHYEIAGYGTARTYAQLLGDREAEQLLQQTLDEESMADEKLTKIARNINVEAMKG